MIGRLVANVAALTVLALQAPHLVVSIAMVPLCATALTVAASGRGRPWTDLGAIALAAVAVGLAGPLGLQADAAVAAVVTAASVILPSPSAPKLHRGAVGLLWSGVLVVLAIAVWLPARLASKGSPALLDPASGAGLMSRSLAVLAVLAIAGVAASAAVHRLKRDGSQTVGKSMQRQMQP